VTVRAKLGLIEHYLVVCAFRNPTNCRRGGCCGATG